MFLAVYIPVNHACCQVDANSNEDDSRNNRGKECQGNSVNEKWFADV